MAGDYQPRREQGSQQKGRADAEHTSGPAQAVECLSQHGTADEAAEEVAGQVHAARRRTIGACCAADKTGGYGLREKRADADQHQT